MKNELLQVAMILTREAGFSKAHLAAETAKDLKEEQTKLLERVRKIGKSENPELMVATEKVIVKSELEHHANSKGMVSSLNAAITELTGIEKLLAIVDDKQEYSRVDQAYSFPKNREKGLPLDEARQAFKSHHARLNNLDRARLSEDEKKIIDTRKSNIFQAGKLYTERQAKTLGVDLAQGKKRGNRL